MFFLKKLIGGLLMPVPMVLGLVLIGAMLLLARKRKIGLAFVVAGSMLLYVASIGPVSRELASSLEFQYPAYAQQPVSYVVVLGSGHDSDERIPKQSQLTRTGLARLTMGLLVYGQNPGAKILLSGYAGSDSRSHALVAAEVAQYLGVPAQDILLAPDAKDTREEAKAWRKVLHKETFALVTSAIHMPRAMELFVNEGLAPIAAPANFEAAGKARNTWHSWLPKATNLALTEAAWHEYLGLAWGRFQTVISKD